MDYVRVDFILGEEATLYFVSTFLPAGGTMPPLMLPQMRSFDVLQIGSLEHLKDLRSIWHKALKDDFSLWAVFSFLRLPT